MNSYELTIIIKPGSIDDVKNVVKNIFTKNSAEIESEEDWGTKKLAYAIEDCLDGYYWFINLKSDPLKIKDINAQFLLNSSIIRHMFIVK